VCVWRAICAVTFSDFGSSKIDQERYYLRTPHLVPISQLAAPL